MQFVNEVSVDASPDQLFGFVADVERVATCLPGARITGRDGEDWNGAMRVKIGPILANYEGTLRFLELDPEERRAAIKAQASEANGQGSAEARITTAILAEADGGSRITITTDLQIRGRVAQFGRGAMEKISEKMFAEFARNLEQAMSGPAAGEAEAVERPAPEPTRLPQPIAPSTRSAPDEGGDDDVLDVLDLVDGASLRLGLSLLAVGIVSLAFGFLLGERRGLKERLRA